MSNNRVSSIKTQPRPPKTRCSLPFDDLLPSGCSFRGRRSRPSMYLATPASLVRRSHILTNLTNMFLYSHSTVNSLALLASVNSGVERPREVDSPSWLFGLPRPDACTPTHSNPPPTHTHHRHHQARKKSASLTLSCAIRHASAIRVLTFGIA